MANNLPTDLINLPPPTFAPKNLTQAPALSNGANALPTNPLDDPAAITSPPQFKGQAVTQPTVGSSLLSANVVTSVTQSAQTVSAAQNEVTRGNLFKQYGGPPLG